MIRLASLCLVLCVAAGTVSLARADRKTDAHAAESRAGAAFAKKDYATALTEYQASYATYPKPYLLFHIGECYRLLGKGTEAVATYKLYIAKVSKGASRRKAVEYIAQLDIAPAPEEAPVVAAPAPQVQDTEAPPVTDEEIARKRREEAERRKKGIPDNAILAAPSTNDPLPPGYDPKNLVVDPHDPKVAPPPERFYPVGYKTPWYRKPWPWIGVGAAVVVGVSVGCGIAFGHPKFNSELPIGGPGARGTATMAAHLMTVRF